METQRGNTIQKIFGIDPFPLQTSKIPPSRWPHYYAILKWLNYKPTSDDSLEIIQGYIEILYHLCSLHLWEPINVVLSIKIDTNRFKKDEAFPLCDYFIIKDLSNNLIKICQHIIDSFKDRSDIGSIFILKSRALFNINKPQEASKVLVDIYQSFYHDTEMFVEALSLIGKYQLHIGNYEVAFTYIQHSLLKIEDFLMQDTNLKILEIKAGILDDLALYEMNNSQYEKALLHFSESAEVYSKILTIAPDQNQILIKMMFPLGHQGIIFRKMCNSPIHVFPFTKLRFFRFKGIIYNSIEENYKLATDYLLKALLIAEKLEYEHGFFWANHHLAWIYLNQGNLSQAEVYCNIALEGNITAKTMQGVADCYEQLGIINLVKGSEYITIAEENLKKSLNIRKSDNPHGTASTLIYLALASCYERQYFEMFKLLKKGFYVYYKIKLLNTTRFTRIFILFYSWFVINKKTLTM
jgi:tetratricopeptide (TPR) repeat protein